MNRFREYLENTEWVPMKDYKGDDIWMHTLSNHYFQIDSHITDIASTLVAAENYAYDLNIPQTLQGVLREILDMEGKDLLKEL